MSKTLLRWLDRALLAVGLVRTRGMPVICMTGIQSPRFPVEGDAVVICKDCKFVSDVPTNVTLKEAP
jgi:hypothetical protein